MKNTVDLNSTNTREETEKTGRWFIALIVSMIAATVILTVTAVFYASENTAETTEEDMPVISTIPMILH